jgi:2Fe-2S ferredoxin
MSELRQERAIVKVIFVEADGERFEVEASAGMTLMQAAISNSIPGVLGECGGACACATCHVFVDPAWRPALTAATAFELDILQGALDPDENSRLSCQITLTPELDGLQVRLPPSQI